MFSRYFELGSKVLLIAPVWSISYWLPFLVLLRFCKLVPFEYQAGSQVSAISALPDPLFQPLDSIFTLKFFQSCAK